MLRAVLIALLAAAPAAAQQRVTLSTAEAAANVTLFRIFLLDGSVVVSYGEYIRVGGDVVLSLPSGDPAAPRPRLLTLPAALVDWPRTERYTASARYQWYLAARAEEDFAQMNTHVAMLLNQIALTTEPARALAIAEEARDYLIRWPSDHYGYRDADVREIVGIIDEAISSLSPAGSSAGFQLSLVTAPAPIAVEPLLGVPRPAEQAAGLLSASRATATARDRVALLEAALAVLDAAASGDADADLRLRVEETLREEHTTDRKYAELVDRVMADAGRAAADARVSAVEQLFDEVEHENARLGGTRPAVMQALRAALGERLEAARGLQTRRMEWMERRQIYRDYVTRASAQIVQLVKSHDTLDAIRRMAGLAPRRVRILQKRLRGGLEQLQAMVAPDRLRPAHDLIVAAWRFAEDAAERRRDAVIIGDDLLVAQAASAAAGSLLLLARAQAEMRSALELPQLR